MYIYTYWEVCVDIHWEVSRCVQMLMCTYKEVWETWSTDFELISPNVGITFHSQLPSSLWYQNEEFYFRAIEFEPVWELSRGNYRVWWFLQGFTYIFRTCCEPILHNHVSLNLFYACAYFFKEKKKTVAEGRKANCLAPKNGYTLGFMSSDYISRKFNLHSIINSFH